MGMRAEEKVFNMLERRFYNEPCLLLPGYVETHLFRVARAVLPGIVEDDFPLSAEELEIWSTICRADIKQFTEDVWTWLKNVPVDDHGHVNMENLIEIIEEVIEE